MRLEFDITLTAKDMFRFNMYQTYTGASGWISVIAAVICFIAAGTKYSERGLSYAVLGSLLGVLILFYMPVTLYLRSKQRIAASEVLKNSLHYCVDEEGITVKQGDADAKLLWDQIYKMMSTKNNVLVYSNRINAYVIPRQQLGEKYRSLADLAKDKLPKYRVKLK
ncbi:YcxB family protein [Roseburia sp.]|uniref:YcxB family protein n=1 Tax=Roseburia sp. TaxID=2049040 RepID=UPI00351FD8DD